MRKLLLALAALAFTTPAMAATSSADLDAIAKVLEQNAAPNTTLNSQLLSLLREPAKTLDGVTLPSTAAQYTTTIDTALKLRPKGWIAGGIRNRYPARRRRRQLHRRILALVDRRGCSQGAWASHGIERLGQGQLCVRCSRPEQSLEHGHTGSD
jgi:hypothetical protein